MRLILDNTGIIVKVGDTECRLWTGYAGTEKVNVFIACIGIDKDSPDLKYFEEELLTIPGRLLLGDQDIGSLHV
jgi:hypothetical protein